MGTSDVTLYKYKDELKGFDLSLRFKEWIENTPLFGAIKVHAGTGLIIESLPHGLSLELNRVAKIEKAEDLPIEMIKEFFINSPFYNQIKQENESKI